ncbi:MAG: molybdenum cofactor biosynthesis protein MoaE [Methanoregulaceae archaeon]
MIRVQREDVDIGAMIEAAKKREMGAVVTFDGIVRDDDIDEMEVEAYEEVAVRDMEEIRNEAIAKFRLQSADIVHRIGKLGVGENILVIVVGAGHRREAFQGCEYILERIKERAPFWKKEYRKEGASWVKGNLEH